MRNRLAATFLAMLLLLVQALPAVACVAKCSMGHCDEPKQAAPVKAGHGCCNEGSADVGHSKSKKESKSDHCDCGCSVQSTPVDQHDQIVATTSQVQVFPGLAILPEPFQAPQAPISGKLARIVAQDSGPPGNVFFEQSHSRAPPVA